MVLPPGARFHYSNLAYALLGIVVERVSGVPYMDYVRQQLFEPVGLTRLSFETLPAAAKGYIAQPYADGVWNAVDVETGAWASAGQLWGTVGDLCRWGEFLADPDEAVLAKKSAEEMRTVQVIAEHQRWLAGYGLGLILRRDGERILAGHTGSMPGFIAFLFASPAEKVVAAVLTNESQAMIGDLGLSLVRTTVEEWPVAPESASRRPAKSCRSSASGSSRLRSSSSAGGRANWRRASTGSPTGSRPRSSSARLPTAGARSRARSTARRCGSNARRTGR